MGREALCLQSIEVSSRHREMGRAQPVLFHRAVRGCLQQLLLQNEETVHLIKGGNGYSLLHSI